jgi:uncharacterized membrane protein YbhN (UPF0104 family)
MALRGLVGPKALLSLAFGVAALVGLVAFGDAARVAGSAARVRSPTLLAYAACMVAHEVARGAAWCFLLRRLGVCTPLRAQVFAFGVGEVVKDLPAGAFLPNYVLREGRGAGLGDSAAATFAVLGAEIAAGSTAVAVFGLGGVRWARVAALGAIAATALVALGARRYLSAGLVRRWLPRPLERLPGVRKTLRGTDNLRHGLRRVLRRDTVAVVFAAVVLSELLAATALFVVVSAIVESQTTTPAFPAVLAAHGASVAVALGLPLPIDFGALEVSGVAALLAVGLPKHTAVAAMVLNRAVSIVVALLTGATLAALFRRELRRAWDSRRAAPTDGRPGCRAA